VKIVGREKEVEQMRQAIALGKNLLIEGPVGVGKTFLVLEVLKKLKKSHERVDGDTRYTEQKLTGWFDPPLVLKKGYVKDCFIDGPLLLSMKQGKALFINELNRMPEAVQNVLLPAMDERKVVLPKLGMVGAKGGFLVIATQNPREFTATHMLSEALMDRFEMIHLAYQSVEEELEILKDNFPTGGKPPLEKILELIRATRDHASIKRGASIRAAVAVASLLKGGMDLEAACVMGLSGRIEMVSSEESAQDVILSLLKDVYAHPLKKKF